jgi:hypothetical protein
MTRTTVIVFAAVLSVVATAQTVVGLPEVPAAPKAQPTETTAKVPTPTLSAEGWGKTKWGMTQDQVKGIFPALTMGDRQVYVPPVNVPGQKHRNYSGSWTTLRTPMLPEFSVGDVAKFQVFFNFTSDSLQSVYLERPAEEAIIERTG